MVNEKKCLSRKKNSNGILELHISYYSQPAIKCSKLTIETIEQSVKYVQS